MSGKRLFKAGLTLGLLIFVRKLIIVLREVTLDLRTLILFEGGRRKLTLGLRTLILFEGGRKELILHEGANFSFNLNTVRMPLGLLGCRIFQRVC